MSIRKRLSTITQTDEGQRRQSIASVSRESIEGPLWALPYLLAFGVFLLWPLIKGLWMSFHEWDPLFPQESEWIGPQNYVELFTSDPVLWNSLWHTIYFVILTVPAMVILSLALALGVNREVKGSSVLRTIFFSPYVLTIAVVAFIWVELLGTDFGPVNYYLGFVGLKFQWLTSTELAMPSLAVTTIWWLLGFNFIIFLAARQNVPERLYEAARLDGANTWRQFRDITLPQMRNAILFVLIIQFIFQFQVFGQPYIMTGGGPADATRTIVYYLYEAAFNNHEYGYAAAIGYILFAILVGISVVNYYVLGGDVNE